MAKHVHTTVRYDGPALQGHEMDVQELAPALLALAEMIQLANKKFNGDAATMKVLVRADIEQRCFQLDIHIVQTILDTAKHLFGTDDYKTAKEIAEALDLIGAVTLPPMIGLFGLWKLLYGRQAPDDQATTAITVEQHGGQTTLLTTFDGSAIQVNNVVYNLSIDPEMIGLGKKVLHPLKHPGYDTLGFYSGEKSAVEWTKDEASRFIARSPSEMAPPPEDDTVNRVPIRTVVSVKTQRNEGRAQWEIRWASKAQWASMDDYDWLDNFQAGKFHFDIPYWLDVTLEMTTSRVDPDAPPTFAIKKVHSLINSKDGKQGDLLDDEELNP